MWFIFFLLLNGFIRLAGVELMEAFPYFLIVNDKGNFALENLNLLNQSSALSTNFPPIINISNVILTIVLGIVLFGLTSLLLDKKVEI